MSDDGELPESEGELVDSEDEKEETTKLSNQTNYTMFNTTNLTQVCLPVKIIIILIWGSEILKKVSDQRKHTV